MIVPPPDGYDSWLDYAVASMDTRRLYLESIADGRDHSREDMRESAASELAALREGTWNRRTEKQTAPTSAPLVPCSLCGCLCEVVGDDPEGTHYYIPRRIV